MGKTFTLFLGLLLAAGCSYQNMLTDENQNVTDLGKSIFIKSYNSLLRESSERSLRLSQTIKEKIVDKPLAETPPDPENPNIEDAENPTTPENSANRENSEDADEFKDMAVEQWFQEAIKKQREIKEQEGIKTTTKASLVFVPVLDSVQPALVQSISLGNFLRYYVSSYRPDDVRNEAENFLIKHANNIQLPDGKKISTLDANSYEYLLNKMAEEMQRQKRQDLSAVILDSLSLDIGLSFPSAVIGNESDTFARKVDDEFPQFLFGGGLDFGYVSFSGGAMLYRNQDTDFEVQYYVGANLDLYEAFIGSSNR